MSLYLIGPRGAGKSSAGAAAARALAVPFRDTDRVIEIEAGASVSELFAARGEAAFRVLERRAVLAQFAAAPGIVATGGGAVLDPEVCAILARQPGTIWLDADVPTLAGRIRGSARPSLTGAPSDEELGAVLQTRAPLYAAASRSGRRLDSGAQSLDELTQCLITLWQTVAHEVVR